MELDARAEASLGVLFSGLCSEDFARGFAWGSLLGVYPPPCFCERVRRLLKGLELTGKLLAQEMQGVRKLLILKGAEIALFARSGKNGGLGASERTR
jgi:hypothetical protein